MRPVIALFGLIFSCSFPPILDLGFHSWGTFHGCDDFLHVESLERLAETVEDAEREAAAGALWLEGGLWAPLGLPYRLAVWTGWVCNPVLPL